MKKLATTLFKLTLSILLTTSFSFTYAQSTGKLSGKVTDKKIGEALIGASVLIEGISKGAASNVNGEYSIVGIPAGTYTVLVRYIGYQSKQISEVQVKRGDATSLNVILDEANTQQLQAVTVKATFRQESNNSLYAQQKNSSRVSDGISAEAIRRSPDRNIGEVLKRVSGATVTEGRFIVVRGLGDRYNTTMLNNAVLPSTEPDKKAFSFDIVPSSLVDNIVINKTATPDLPGDFAGGAVQVTTKDFPDKKIVTLQLGVAGNTKTTFKDFKQGSMQKLDFLGGFDNGSRSLPATWVRLNKNDYVTAPLAQQTAITQQFNNSYGVKHQFKGYPGQNLQLTVGNTKQFSNDSKLGYVASFTYGNNIERFDRERNEVSFSNGEPTYNFNDNLYRFTNSLGGILNVSYSHKNSKYSLKNTYNNTFVNNFTNRDGQFLEGGESNLVNVRSTQTDVNRSGILSSVFEGQHFLTKSKINIDYNVSYGKSYRYQPDQRILEQFQTPSASPNWYVQLSNITSPAIQNAGRLYTNLDENIYGGKFNVAIPYQLFKQSNKLKFGYLTSYRDRTFTAEALGYASGVRNSDRIFLVDGLTVDNVFSRSSIAQRGIVISRINGYTFSYDGTVKLDAGYLMTENKLSDKLRMILGARVERYKQTIQQPGIANSKQNYLNTDVLPSVNFTYALTPKSNLRLAASQTVARPELRELANFLYYDFVTDYSVRGNVDLKRTLISNFDLRYELFPSAGQIVSVSAFYKDFKNAIEQTAGGNRDFGFQNATSAYDYGAELEFRRRLDLFGDQPYLKSLTFYANAAYIRSRVNVVNGNANRPLQGQSPYILNGGLQYAGANNGLVLNLLYNRIGQRLTYVGVSGGRDIYENPRDLVDFQIGKRLMKNKAEIKLNVSDIFAQSIRLYTNFDSKTSYNPNNGDKSFQSTIPGRNINLQFIYNF